jgi:hypothetical protein
MIEHFIKARALKGKDAQLGKEFLLMNTQTKCASG